MSNRSSRGNSWDTSVPNPFLAAASGFDAWHPLLISMTKTNGEVAEGFGTFFSEWQNFVGHRLQQDLFLWQKLAESRSPQDTVAVYADFWQKAAADYCQEYATMSKLLAGITGKAISQAQSASLVAAKTAPSAGAA
jgi:hypothetical protein